MNTVEIVQYLPYLQGLILVLILGRTVFFIMTAVMGKKQLLPELARQWNGEIKKGMLFSPPTLAIPRYGLAVNVRLVSGTNTSPPYTFLETREIADKEFFMSLEGNKSIAEVMKYFGGQDILMNNPAFDEPFVIRSNDEPRLRAILTSAVQEKLLRFKDLGPVVVLKKGNFSLRVPVFFDNVEDLNRFVQTGMMLVDKLMGIV